MFNLKMIKIMKYFLQIAIINKISLYAANLEIGFYYLIYYIGPKYFNLQKSVLYTEKSVFGQIITFNKNKIISKKLITAIPNIKYNQVMNKTSNIELLNMKVLTIIKT